MTDEVTPPASSTTITAEVTVRVEISIPSDRQVLLRVDDEWRQRYIPTLERPRDIIQHLAGMAARGVGDVSQLEGWRDLAPGAATMVVQGAQLESWEMVVDYGTGKQSAGETRDQVASARRMTTQ